MALSSSSSVCLTSDWQEPISPLVRKASTTSTTSCTSRRNYNLVNDQILVKVSHVNDALSDLQTELYDDEEKEDCHFVRIVRIGPKTKNESTLPGTLVVVQRKRGILMEELSEDYGEKYYLLLESDIKTYIAL